MPWDLLQHPHHGQDGESLGGYGPQHLVSHYVWKLLHHAHYFPRAAGPTSVPTRTRGRHLGHVCLAPLPNPSQHRGRGGASQMAAGRWRSPGAWIPSHQAGLTHTRAFPQGLSRDGRLGGGHRPGRNITNLHVHEGVFGVTSDSQESKEEGRALRLEEGLFPDVGKVPKEGRVNPVDRSCPSRQCVSHDL